MNIRWPFVLVAVCCMPVWPTAADARSLESLHVEITSNDKQIREQAIREAPRHGAAAIPLLESVFLRDGSEGHYPMMRPERLLALQSLAEIGGPEAIPVLVVAAADLEKPVRVEAQRQLRDVHGVSLDDLQSRFLLSDDFFIRRGAIVTLLDHGATADELTVRLLPLASDPVNSRRVAAIQAIGQLGSRNGIPALKAIIVNESTPGPERLEALGSLHHIDTREVPLEGWILALGDEGMRGLYMATLSGVHISMHSLEAAGGLAVPVLEKTLEHADPVRRMRAAWVLGRLGAVATVALPALRKAADDPVWYVADEARRALARVSPDEPVRQPSRPAEPRETPPVTVDELEKTVVLGNGLVSCEVEKASGSLVSIQRAGDDRDLLGTNGAWYATLPWVIRRGESIPRWQSPECRVVQNGDDCAEVVVTRRLDAPRPIVQEQHFVLRRGVSGVYEFAVFRKPQEMEPAPKSPFDYGRFMKADARILRCAAVSDTLHGELDDPDTSAKQKFRISELSNATHRLPDGRITAKYSWCPYEQESTFHGATGDGIGLWVIIPNNEFGYAIPTNYPGTIHSGKGNESSVVFVTHQEGAPHNVGSEQRFSLGAASWEKFYGPNLLYVNGGASHAEMYADAKRRAEIEAAAHPAQWVKHELYPRERASVRGSVVGPDGQPAGGAWVILCVPNPDPDRAWQRHKGPYVYQAFAKTDGSFELEGVRPGTYSLFARVDGVLGVARVDGVKLQAGDRHDFGKLTIREDCKGKILWQIGEPDGTPRDFVGAVDSHEWCGWFNNYRRFFPHDVEFTVGKSDSTKDWYYAQPSGWPAAYGEAATPTAWRIHFDLDTVPADGAILTVCVAATRGGKLALECNDTKLPVHDIVETWENSLCMAPDRGSFYGFRTERFQLDAESLKTGRNTLTFRFGSGRNRGEAIMYDMIRLETIVGPEHASSVLE